MTEVTQQQTPPTLYVDLDGTLVAVDTLVVSLRLLIRRRPWLLPVLPLFVIGGRSSFKERVARRVTVDPSGLPYRPDVLAFLEEEKDRGRTVVLATAAHRLVAQPIADHLGIFEDVIASDDSHNLKGHAKLEAIQRHAGAREFEYMGDSMADLPILRAANAGYLVCPSVRLRKAAGSTCRIERIFEGT
jgi:phosphoserine phosphatase